MVVNAAGAWADAVAELAGVGPIGLMPLRRTIITFDGPEGEDVSGWPFAKTVGDELYFAPEVRPAVRLADGRGAEPTPATRSPTNMRSRSPRIAWRSARR